MSVPLPPWLDIGPQSYLGAEEAGARIGLAQGEAARRAAIPPDDNSAAIAQQNIANMFKAQEMARQQQQDQLQQQQYEAQVKVQADQMARKYSAMQQYKSRIAGGEDPLKVLMEVGPEAGLGASAEAAAIRSMYQKPKPTQAIPMPEVQFADVAGQKVPYLVDKRTGRGSWLPSGYLPKTAKSAPLTENQREVIIARYEAMRQKIEDGADMFKGMDKADPSWPDKKKAQFNSYKNTLDRIDSQIKRLQEGEAPMPDEGQSPDDFYHVNLDGEPADEQSPPPKGGIKILKVTAHDEEQ